MKIVIFGLARSGTTALFYKIKNSLPPRTVCLFEPRFFDSRAVKVKRFKSLLSHSREPDVLAKVLPFRPSDPADTDSFSLFEKQILIVRDPRDRLISRLLYGVYHSDFCRHDDKVKTFLEALEQKEADPRSLPVKTLLAIFADLNGEKFSLDAWVAAHRLHSIRKPLDFHDGREGMFLFKYEDLVDQRFGSLEDYLGVRLKGNVSVAAEFSRVTRTRSYGGWRDWLTPEDVEYLRPVLQPFLNRFYPEADWELSPSPLIPAEYSSRYVQRIVNDRRASLKLPRFVYARRELEAKSFSRACAQVDARQLHTHGRAMIDLTRLTPEALSSDPYRWAFIDRLFAPADGEALVETFPRDHFKTVIGYDGEKGYEYEARSLIPMGAVATSRAECLSPVWRRLAEELLSPAYRAAISRLTGLELAGLPMEVNVFHYSRSAWLGPHVDLEDKVVTHVFYFNDVWDESDGGCLTILRSAEMAQPVLIVPPLVGNSAVLVRSDNSWHAVSRVRDKCRTSRRSMTITFYRPGSLSTLWPVGDTTPLHNYTGEQSALGRWVRQRLGRRVIGR